MNHFKKYICRLRTCSALVLSPRGQCAYYRGAGDFDTKCLRSISQVEDNNNVNIIYPFYQYGYEGRYMPQDARHYIPGSSLKGAIGSNQLRVDDFPVDGKSIHLRTLMKVQDPPGVTPAVRIQTTLGPFFPNVAVEMMDAGTECVGEFFSETDPREILSQAEEKVKARLGRLAARLEILCDNAPPCADALKKLCNNLESLYNPRQSNETSYLLLLGGYKGMLLSGDFTTEELQSAIFVDTETMLPHGLVLLTLVDE